MKKAFLALVIVFLVGCQQTSSENQMVCKTVSGRNEVYSSIHITICELEDATCYLAHSGLSCIPNQ